MHPRKTVRRQPLPCMLGSHTQGSGAEKLSVSACDATCHNTMPAFAMQTSSCTNCRSWNAEAVAGGPLIHCALLDRGGNFLTGRLVWI